MAKEWKLPYPCWACVYLDEETETCEQGIARFCMGCDDGPFVEVGRAKKRVVPYAEVRDEDADRGDYYDHLYRDDGRYL